MAVERSIGSSVEILRYARRIVSLMRQVEIAGSDTLLLARCCHSCRGADAILYFVFRMKVGKGIMQLSILSSMVVRLPVG